MKFLQVRHATSIITYAGLRILVDPVFAEKGAYPAIPMTPNRRKNPMVDLITPMDTLFDVDLILSTHIHNDHFDDKAMKLLDKNLALICQSNDANTLCQKGFRNLIPVDEVIRYKNIIITRVYAQHGSGAVGKAMGPASGYILEAEKEPTIYITGDTIYNHTIRENIRRYRPKVLIMNAGSPKFLNSDRIVMNIMDLEETMKVNPGLTFVIVHLNTFNHCIETREDIREYFSPEKLNDMRVKKFYLPKDNELLNEDCFVK